MTLPLTSAIWQPDVYFDNSVSEWSLGVLFVSEVEEVLLGVTGMKENHPMSVSKPFRFLLILFGNTGDL